MNNLFKAITLKSTGADDIFEVETIQNLWSGYGKIIRYGLKGADRETVVVKHVILPEHSNQPHGWNTEFAHERKIKSYLVETVWYDRWAHRCDDSCRIPECFAIESKNDEIMLVLEDLNSSGYPRRKKNISLKGIKVCLTWLANFHATFMGETSEYLWEVGTYWHLDTRPDEYKVMNDIPLKKAARTIDKKLQDSPYQTFVHGDAKLANFCFSSDGTKVAAVDFQYVGGGCGMKDVAYFIGSCLFEEDCEKLETTLLDFYFQELRMALTKRNKNINLDELEADWRALYPVAWTDFHRFLKGWRPDHWKINSYSERLAKQVVESLTN